MITSGISALIRVLSGVISGYTWLRWLIPVSKRAPPAQLSAISALSHVDPLITPLRTLITTLIQVLTTCKPHLGHLYPIYLSELIGRFS